MSSEIDDRLFGFYALMRRVGGRRFCGKTGNRTCRMSFEIDDRLFGIYDENYHEGLVIHHSKTQRLPSRN
ncbi:hypothetical protein [Fundicoccus culcitae]|uniref:Uncharacterized protein n=1 Tax=Fundicoccus culcitae TaxID=2969821 RepID=A0ABY5P833_9LACT|nr:hypothetical protein [Fundicoccus culcitae]UUX34741.1 hypothetical protein NRE15_03570 [Fundicoccus culcitae]